MQRVPPIDGEFYDRQIDHAYQRQHRARPPAARGIIEAIHQRDITDIEEEQHQHRGEACVPDPPCPPHGLAPERAGDEAEEREGRAQGCCGLSRDIRERMPPDQRDRARERQKCVGEACHPCRRHVHEHDPHGLALLVVRRRHEERQVEPKRQADRRARCAPGHELPREAHEPAGIGKSLHRSFLAQIGPECQVGSPGRDKITPGRGAEPRRRPRAPTAAPPRGTPSGSGDRAGSRSRQ